MKPSPQSLVIDGQAAQVNFQVAAWLKEFAETLATNNQPVVVISNQNESAIKWSKKPPAVLVVKLDLAPFGPPQASKKGRNRQQITNWLIEKKLFKQPFLVASPNNLDCQPTWAGQGLRISLWPDLAKPIGQNQPLPPLARADLLIANDSWGAKHLQAAGIPLEKIVLVKAPSQSVHQGSLKQTAFTRKNIIWLVGEKLSHNDQVFAKAWLRLRVLTEEKINLIALGRLNLDDQEHLERELGRHFYYLDQSGVNLSRAYKATKLVVFNDYSSPDLFEHFLLAIKNQKQIVAPKGAPLSRFLEPDHYLSYGSAKVEPLAKLAHLGVVQDLDKEQKYHYQQLEKYHSWPVAGRKIQQQLRRSPTTREKPKIRLAAVGDWQISANQSELAKIITTPGNWPDGYWLDYLKPGQTKPLNWPVTNGREVEEVIYQDLASVKISQLKNYRANIYNLIDPDYRVLARALTIPGIVVADNLNFEKAWRQLLARKLVSRRRFRLEKQIEKRLKIGSDCSGGYSLITRSRGLMLSSKKDCQIARSLRSQANRVKLISRPESWGVSIDKIISNYCPLEAAGRSLIDVTSLFLNWSNLNRLTGIQRYEQQLLKNSLKDKAVGYIYHQAGQSHFCLLKRELVAQLVKLIDDQQSGQTLGINKRRYRLKIALEKSDEILLANNHDRLLIPQGVWQDSNYSKMLIKLSHQCQVFQVIYDLIPINSDYADRQTERHLRNYLNQVLPSRPHVITISNHSAQDIKKYYQKQNFGRPTSLKTIYLGDDPVEPKGRQKPGGQVFDQPFLLTVSTVEARKNHQILIDVYRQALKAKIKLPPTVIVGRIGWGTAKFLKTVKDDSYLSRSILIYEKINDRQLAWLYENCQLTIFASFYEGWGLPVPESLANFKPTLVAKTSSLVEAGGHWADYFDPGNPRQLLNLILNYQNEEIRQRKIKAIKNSYRPRLWSKAISETLDYLVEATN